MSDLERLSGTELDALTRFMLAHMEMDTRLALMRAQPVTYVKLYPCAYEEVLKQVRAALQSAVCGDC
jgi:hypothetical protein